MFLLTPIISYLFFMNNFPVFSLRFNFFFYLFKFNKNLIQCGSSRWRIIRLVIDMDCSMTHNTIIYSNQNVVSL